MVRNANTVMKTIAMARTIRRTKIAADYPCASGPTPADGCGTCWSAW